MKKQSFIKRLISKVHQSKLEFNYIFFGLFFLAIIILNVYHITVIRASSWQAKAFFISYAIGQTFIELGILLLIACWLKKKASKVIHYFFIGSIALFLFSQLAEFLLVSLMDISFKEALDIAFGADLDNFIELLYLSDIGIMLWIVFFSFAAILPLLGILFYKLTDKLSQKKPISFKRGTILKPLYAIPLLLFGMDFFVSYKLLNQDYSIHRKALPWNMTFLEENTSELFLDHPFDPQVNLPKFYQDMQTTSIFSEKKPNIYLFVTESLREDYLDEKTSPNLYQFKKDYLSAKTACSSSNGTHISWFSIFYALQPFYWSYMQNQSLDKGSPPLYLLKKMGYNIHALSSAELRYYSFHKVIFGKHGELLDQYEHYPHKGNFGADASDINAFESLKASLEKEDGKEGNVYILFLDSTHFTYSWPKNMQVPFHPASELTFAHYMSSDPSKLQEIQNRYRNSIYFVDKLFGDFTDFLKKKDLYDDSVIIFTGDHGEEFKERGKLFHASNLSRMQTRVPLYMKLGTYKKSNPLKVASHIDIFPTVLHYLTSSEDLNRYFHGDSLISSHHKPYAITARYNSCKHPYEFVADNGKERLYLRFPNSSIFQANKVKILALQKDTEEIKPTKKQAMKSFSQVFHDLFDLDL